MPVNTNNQPHQSQAEVAPAGIASGFDNVQFAATAEYEDRVQRVSTIDGPLRTAIEATPADVAGFDSEKFAAVPEHEGSLQSLIERYGTEPARCPYIQSMGAAGVEFITKLAEAENKPNRGPTIRELMAERKARDALPKVDQTQSAGETKKDTVNIHQTVREHVAKTEELLDTVINPDVVKSLTENMEQQAIANLLLQERLTAIEANPDSVEVPPNTLHSPSMESTQSAALLEHTEASEQKIQPTGLSPTPVIPKTPDKAAPAVFEVAPATLGEVKQAKPIDVDTGSSTVIEITEEDGTIDQPTAEDTDGSGDNTFFLATEIELAAEEDASATSGVAASWETMTESDEDTGLSAESEFGKPTAANVLTTDTNVAETKKIKNMIVEQLEAYFPAAFGPEERTAALDLVNSLSEIVEAAHKTDYIIGEKSLAISAELKELSLQLIEKFGIEHSDEIIEHFMRLIANHSLTTDTTSNALSLERRNALGTHEYLLTDHQSIVTDLMQFLRYSMKSPLLLGKYAIAA